MLRKLLFSLIYFQKPVWDTGISPPELLSYMANRPPGKALDLGCGTGTNVITLAKSGWQVTGVDFSRWAVHLARKKARQSGVKADLRVDDVTRMKSIGGSFNLILDIGCFHSLPPSDHERYIKNIHRLLAADGTFLLYSFIKDTKVIAPGVAESDFAVLSQEFKLISRQDGTDRGIRPSAWLTFINFPMQ